MVTRVLSALITGFWLSCRISSLETQFSAGTTCTTCNSGAYSSASGKKVLYFGYHTQQHFISANHVNKKLKEKNSIKIFLFVFYRKFNMLAMSGWIIFI
jgi:hypothetical protein